MYSLFGFFSSPSVCDTFLVGEAVVIIIAGLFPTMRTYDPIYHWLCLVRGSYRVLLCTFLSVYAFQFVDNQD